MEVVESPLSPAKFYDLQPDRDSVTTIVPESAVCVVGLDSSQPPGVCRRTACGGCRRLAKLHKLSATEINKPFLYNNNWLVTINYPGGSAMVQPVNSNVDFGLIMAKNQSLGMCTSVELVLPSLELDLLSNDLLARSMTSKLFENSELPTHQEQVNPSKQGQNNTKCTDRKSDDPTSQRVVMPVAAHRCNNTGLVVFQYPSIGTLDQLQLTQSRVESIWAQFVEAMVKFQTIRLCHNSLDRGLLFEERKGEVILKFDRFKYSSYNCAGKRIRPWLPAMTLMSVPDFNIKVCYSDTAGCALTANSYITYKVNYQQLMTVRKLGLSLFYESFDTYMGLVTLMKDERFRRHVLNSPSLAAKWYSIWEPSEYFDVMKAIESNGTHEQILDGRRLRCSILSLL